MHINSFLVRQLKLSHQQIKEDINSNVVFIDDKIAMQKQEIRALNTIKYKQEILQVGKQLFYYAYHKPVGVESTLNKEIPDNLIEATGIQDYFFPIGRLDKASEGLMILTNDGILYKQIVDVGSDTEKIYEVEVDQEIDKEFISKMAEGIVIMGSSTKPCKVSMLSNHTFSITLVEGRNRQIRRMCYKLGYEVLVLKRIAISKLSLDDLPVGHYKTILVTDII
jgi:23S rRNA pseudouridine2604 synthase